VLRGIIETVNSRRNVDGTAAMAAPSGVSPHADADLMRQTGLQK
jgi:hypothetical protein